MAKRKKSRKSRERIQREAENSPTVRRLRELYAKGMAELRAHNEAAGIDREEISPAAKRLHELIAEGGERGTQQPG